MARAIKGFGPLGANQGGEFTGGAWPGWRKSHDQVGAQMVTVHLNAGSADEISVRVDPKSLFKTIESLVILFISVVFLTLMAMSSKLYSPAES